MEAAVPLRYPQSFSRPNLTISLKHWGGNQKMLIWIIWRKQLHDCWVGHSQKYLKYFFLQALKWHAGIFLKINVTHTQITPFIVTNDPLEACICICRDPAAFWLDFLYSISFCSVWVDSQCQSLNKAWQPGARSEALI